MAQEGGIFVYVLQRILISIRIRKFHVVHTSFICQPSNKLWALPVVREVDLLVIAHGATTGDDADVDV